MIEALSLWLVFLAQIYLGLGLVFAIAFVIFGVDKIDGSAQGGSLGFRLCILPGVAAFWPFLLLRWIRRSPPREESNAHRDLARRTTQT